MSGYKLTIEKSNVSIPPMRKGYVWIVAVVALLGMANCVLVEPAFACEDAAGTCSTPICHDCLVCGSAGHQWLAPQTSQLLSIPGLANAINISSVVIPVDPPFGSIFHPPTPF